MAKINIDIPVWDLAPDRTSYKSFGVQMKAIRMMLQNNANGTTMLQPFLYIRVSVDEGNVVENTPERIVLTTEGIAQICVQLQETWDNALRNSLT